jgi:hypothetical protein
MTKSNRALKNGLPVRGAGRRQTQSDDWRLLRVMTDRSVSLFRPSRPD